MITYVFEVFILFSSPTGGGLVELLKYVPHSATKFYAMQIGMGSSTVNLVI